MIVAGKLLGEVADRGLGQSPAAPNRATRARFASTSRTVSRCLTKMKAWRLGEGSGGELER